MFITRVYTRMGLVRVLVKRQFERQAIEAFNHSVTVNDKVFRIIIEIVCTKYSNFDVFAPKHTV